MFYTRAEMNCRVVTGIITDREHLVASTDIYKIMD